MNSLLFTLAMVVVGALSVSADEFEDHPFVMSQPENLVQRTLLLARAARQKVVDKGCEVNLCFGIDGSNSTNPIEFKKQVDFVDLMVNILTTDEGGNFCAVQYSTFNSAISSLTSKKKSFIRKLHRAVQNGGLSNIGGALGYLHFQLRPRVEDANKIVLLGDGFDSQGADPVLVANRIHLEGTTDICAVEVGNADSELLAKITGDENRVVHLDNFFELGEIIVGLVNDICGYQS